MKQARSAPWRCRRRKGWGGIEDSLLCLRQNRTGSASAPIYCAITWEATEQCWAERLSTDSMSTRNSEEGKKEHCGLGTEREAGSGLKGCQEGTAGMDKSVGTRTKLGQMSCMEKTLD
jgi:hypothetical protein